MIGQNYDTITKYGNYGSSDTLINYVIAIKIILNGWLIKHGQSHFRLSRASPASNHQATEAAAWTIRFVIG
jgi:hypothetical protein